MPSLRTIAQLAVVTVVLASASAPVGASSSGGPDGPPAADGMTDAAGDRLAAVGTAVREDWETSSIALGGRLAALAMTAGATALTMPGVSEALTLSLPRPVEPQRATSALEPGWQMRTRQLLEAFFRPSVTVSLYNANTREEGVFQLGLDGVVASDQVAALEHLFRCRRTGRHKPMDPGVLAKLADLSRHYPGRVIEVVSGYRAPPFGVPHSRHFRASAIDLRVRGVSITDVRDYLWRRYEADVGVGYYRGQNFVHVDHRPGYKATAWTSPSPGAAYRYRPRWARQVRPETDSGPGAARAAVIR